MYIEESLVKNEKIEEIFSLNWINYLKGCFYLFAAPAVTIAIFYTFKWNIFSLNFLMVIIPLLMLILPFFLVLNSIEQGVTNRRVIKKEGVFSRKTEEIRLDAVQTVQIDQSLVGRILGYGDVMVTGRGTGSMVFEKIDNPMGVKKAIENAAEGKIEETEEI